MNQKTRPGTYALYLSSALIMLVVVSALLIAAHASLVTGDAETGTAPRITDAYVDPLKVVPGDTMLVSAAVGGG